MCIKFSKNNIEKSLHEEKHSNGFTLIELSIVLIIIGLIVAGITGGQSLVKSAELNSIVTQINNVKTAVSSYELQYNYLPGDHINAYSYFDTDGAGSDICGADSAAASGCNGDGDGIIDVAERYRFWQHLALEGTMKGTFTGVAEGSAPTMEAGVNVPESSIKGGALDVLNFSPNGGPTTNYIKFGSQDGALIENSIISVTDAVSVDKKMDDGKADSGTIYAENGADAAAPLCLNAGAYLLSSTGQKCKMSFTLE